MSAVVQSTKDFLEAAIVAAAEFPVFPCNPADKRPLTKRGFKDASSIGFEVIKWWLQHPSALVGVPTGQASRLVVIDDDTVKKPDEASSAWLEANRALLETTRQQTTTSGGTHFIFRLPIGVDIKSRAGLRVNNVKLKSVDIRGEGGYVIWWAAHGYPSLGTIQPLPQALVDQLCMRGQAAVHSNSVPVTPQDSPWDSTALQLPSALAFLTPADRDEWCQMGMAIHHDSRGTENGFSIWHRWSAGEFTGGDAPQAYLGEDDCRRTWNSFGKDPSRAPKTIKSLFELARRRGYRGTQGLPPHVSQSTLWVNDGVPKALHLCTDQANAERLATKYGQQLIAFAGEFYVWEGRRWRREKDTGKARAFACDLSKLVRAEADEMRNSAEAAQANVDAGEIAAHLAHPRLAPLRGGATGSAAYDLSEIAKALDKWSVKCEMRSQQDAALGILKDLLKVDASEMDSDPLLLNCANGTVDLRNGTLRPHDPADLITKMTPVNYDPAAPAPRFHKFLSEIFRGNTLLIEFLARWFGYCASGDVASQAFVVHWGSGSNGKSVLIDTITSALGEYAAPAALGLLTSKNEVHLAEIADLHGKRLVTASESEEGAKLREALLKQATGGDKLKGRHLYGQLFEFHPTHKLQLLTNHKPQIMGTDFAIWRRIHLVPYLETFGTETEVANHQAHQIRDESLTAILKTELPGILAWIIAGAQQRIDYKGLRAPEVVLAASRDYRKSQDRMGEFVAECCVLDIDAWTSKKDVYARYKAWCFEVGLIAFSQRRFLEALEKQVPGYQDDRGAKGTRLVRGVRLQPISE